jgi:hypothetical protein
MSGTAPLPTEEQRQRAKWDLLLADIEFRQEQLRHTRQEIWFKPWQAIFTGLAAGAGLFAAGAAFFKLMQ